MRKCRIDLIFLMCVIVLILSACSIGNDAVHKIVNNNIDIQTKYGDELHFDISSYANLHHQFIKYIISLSNDTEMKNNSVEIILRDPSEKVYNEPLSVFGEITSEEDISLYKLENNYIFIYGDGILTYPTDDDFFKSYTETDVITHFKDIVLDNYTF